MTTATATRDRVDIDDTSASGWGNDPAPRGDSDVIARYPLPVTGKIHPSRADAVTVTLRGRVGTNPDIAELPSGATTVRFRLAVARRGRDDAGVWHDIDTTWYTVKAWNQLATHVYHSLRSGDPVLVHGRLDINEWESDGKHGTELVIVATSIGHDLSLGLSRYSKTARNQRSAGAADMGSPTTSIDPAEGESVGANSETVSKEAPF